MKTLVAFSFLTLSVLAGCSGTDTTSSSPDAGKPTTTLTCGGASCDVTANACCVKGGATSSTFACTASCGAADVAVKCKSNADCGSGGSCCIEHAASGALSATCKTGSCAGAILCVPGAAESANRCGDAGACGSTNVFTWNLPTAYGTCGDMGD